MHCFPPNVVTVVTALSVALMLTHTGVVHAQQATVLNLGNVRPEGIHMITDPGALGLPTDAGEEYALVTELLWGGVVAVDVGTGQKTQLVERAGYFAAAAVGAWIGDGAILICGGGRAFGLESATLRIYDVETQELRATCAPEGALFINDVISIDGIAYASDSMVNFTWTFDIADALEGACTMDSIELPADPFTPTEMGQFQGNGIIPYLNGFLICASTAGSLFYVDVSADTVSQLLPPGSVVFCDGMTIATDDILYVAENNANQVSAWQLSNDGTTPVISSEPLGYVVHPEYDDPATCDLLPGDDQLLYCVNARFSSLGLPAEMEGDLDAFNETFQLIGVDRMDFAEATDAPTMVPALGTTEPTMTPGIAEPTKLPNTSMATPLVGSLTAVLVALSVLTVA